MVDLLKSLERYDTYTAGDALQAAMLELEDDSNWHQGALASIWRGLMGEWQEQTDDKAWQVMIAWAEQRLTAWHSFKTNALLSAWRHDPGAKPFPEGTPVDDPQVMDAHRQRCEDIVRLVVFDLRQGIVDHPELVDDAATLQAMALDGHAFIWRQAHKELIQDQADFNLEPGDPDLALYCWAGSKAFNYLITESE